MLKNIKRFQVAVILLGLLSACGLGNYEFYSLLDKYNGSSERELLLGFGAPNSTYEVSETEKLLVYLESYEDVVETDGGASYIAPAGSGVLTISTVESEVVKRTCKITFNLSNGIVQGHRFDGDGCGKHQGIRKKAGVK